MTARTKVRSPELLRSCFDRRLGNQWKAHSWGMGEGNRILLFSAGGSFLAQTDKDSLRTLGHFDLCFLFF